MGRYQGQSCLALAPESTEQVANILKYCSIRKLAVVPQVLISKPENMQPTFIPAG